MNAGGFIIAYIKSIGNNNNNNITLFIKAPYVNVISGVRQRDIHLKVTSELLTYFPT